MASQKMYVFASLLVAVIVLGGCKTIENLRNEEKYGQREEGPGDDGRQTIVISPADQTIEYRFFDASYETVVIRQAKVEATGNAVGADPNQYRVEVLVKGSFPDSCSELHSVEQQRAGNLILATLTMRRPQGAVCASVLRPYRYYLDLDGTFGPGSYSFKLNEATHPLVIKP